MSKRSSRTKRQPNFTCPKCYRRTVKTEHHILPKRHYGRKGPLFSLCRRCHDKLETYVPFEKMPDEFYYVILVRFLNGDLEGNNGKDQNHSGRAGDLYFRASDIPRFPSRKEARRLEKILPLVCTPDDLDGGLPSHA